MANEITKTAKIEYLEDDRIKEIVISLEDLESGELIGQGSFSIVKRMLLRKTNQTFAVKMTDCRPREANDIRNRQAMDLVVPLTIGNDCPYIVKFYGALKQELYIYILNEIMDTSLDRFLNTVFLMKKITPELFSSKVAFSVCSALQYLKRLNLMHRDIKPSNILLNYNGDIKICDFGISGFTSESKCTTFTGSYLYIAPEKLDTSGYTIKADLWSLGISLIEIATGMNPFKEVDHDYWALVTKIIESDPPKLVTNKFSIEFCSFVESCLKKLPNERANCEELLAHRFIEKYLNVPNDLEFIKSIIDHIKIV